MSANPHDVVRTALAPITELSGAVRDEFRALRSTCGFCDLGPRAYIRLTAGDRVRWLNGMITNNIRDLAPAHGVYAFLLNPQGHILGDLYAYHRGEHLLVVTDQAQREKIVSTFDHYIIADDVELEDASATLTAIAIAGPASHATLRSAGIDAPELHSLQLADLTWDGLTLTLVRGESDRYPSYELWTAPENIQSLTRALETEGATPVGNGARELYRIALGHPRYGQDIRERDLPQETEQQRALDFNKGCYIGQEIVERIRSRGSVHRKFTGFLVDGPPPAPGTKIQMLDRDVGEITSAAVIPGPDGDRTAALGYGRRETSIPGKELQVAGSTARVTELPFTDLLSP